jgi:hypothetical protein
LRLGFAAEKAHSGAMQAPSTLERAFILARSGTCASVGDIRLTLKRERFDQVEAHLAGHAINRQLRALCSEARTARGS